MTQTRVGGNVMSSNHRIAIWSDILLAVTRRIAENELSMSRCDDAEVMKIWVRIQKDDLQRLKDAEYWIAYHQR
jgi:hypothetical protein